MRNKSKLYTCIVYHICTYQQQDYLSLRFICRQYIDRNVLYFFQSFNLNSFHFIEQAFGASMFFNSFEHNELYIVQELFFLTSLCLKVLHKNIALHFEKKDAWGGIMLTFVRTIDDSLVLHIQIPYHRCKDHSGMVHPEKK